MKKTFKKLLALTLTGVLVAGAFQAAARKKIKTANRFKDNYDCSICNTTC